MSLTTIQKVLEQRIHWATASADELIKLLPYHIHSVQLAIYQRKYHQEVQYPMSCPNTSEACHYITLCLLVANRTNKKEKKKKGTNQNYLHELTSAHGS